MDVKLFVSINGFNESVEYSQNLIGKVKLDTMIFNAAVSNSVQAYRHGSDEVTVYFEEV